jgi:hypothetical protein
VIFRRRRTRIEIEENTLTLGLVQPAAATPPPETVPATPSLPQPTSELRLPPAREVDSMPKGTRHVR